MSTRISWTDETWNPIRARLKGSDRWGYHCERISPGCQHCYACTMNGRMLPSWGTGLDYTVPNREKVEIFLDEKELLKPLSWKKSRRVFPCSMTDLFAAFVPDEMIDRMFAVMALTPWHTYQVLTKRADRMAAYCSDLTFARMCDWINRSADGGLHRVGAYNLCSIAYKATKGTKYQGRSVPGPPLPHVWLGVSCEDQKRADERIPHLLRTPAAVRFLSCEPLLEGADILPYLRPICAQCGQRVDASACGPTHAAIWAMRGKTGNWIDWLITGAESGPGARPCQEEWIRSLRDQCVAAGTAFFYKQAIINGKKVETPELDGRRWTEFPEVQA